MSDFTVLGGGWAGLLSAYELSLKFPDATITVLEKSSFEERGGLLKTKFILGHSFDVGGPHILFSRNAAILEKVKGILGSNVKRMHRKVFIFLNGKFIPYPFENGMYLLPKIQRSKIGEQIIERITNYEHSNEGIPRSFLEWIYMTFGTEMSDTYLRPYNEKIWKRDLSKMDADWVYTPGRLPLPSLSEIVKSIAGLREEGYKEQSYFYYPKKGGIQALYDSLLKLLTSKNNIEVKFNEQVETIFKGRNWIVNSKYHSKTLISTLPLPELIHMLKDYGLKYQSKEEFDYNKVITVGLVLDCPTPSQLAVYVPESDVIFHRYSWMSYLDKPTRQKYSSILAEITIPKGRDIVDSTYYVERAVKDFKKLKVISRDTEVIAAESWINEYGYPIYMDGHSRLRDGVLKSIEKLNIYSVGRWGSWHYWNTDKVYEAVQRMVENIV